MRFLINFLSTFNFAIVGAILNKQLGASSCSWFESSEPANSVVPYISWSKKDKKKLLRSLESDFEMVYVAQSCLSWEALHHQYRKAKALESSSSESKIFDKNVATQFQKFQVLLERFMEDEKPEDRRVWNYVQGRFSLWSLLQIPDFLLRVPEVSGAANLDNQKGIYNVMGYDLEKYFFHS